MRQFLFFAFLCFAVTRGFSQPFIKGIYVWDFKMANGSVNNLTTEVSDLYQSLLINNKWADTKILERRQLATILQQRDNEITIGEMEVGFSKELIAEFKTQGADIVVLGVIKQNPGAGTYMVNIKFVHIFSTKILANPIKSVEETIFEDPVKRSTFLQGMLPDLSELSGSQKNTSNNIVDRNKLEIGNEAWKYLQTAYFEDFSNWQERKDFRGDIWNKIDYQPNSSHSCLIEKSRYKIQISKRNYTKHKYIEDPKIGARTDFSMAHPVSVSLHINESPSCISTSSCLGRGISVRFDKKKQTAYAFTLTDDGDLKFFKFDIHNPEAIQPLFSKTIRVVKDRDYELGIIAVGDHFYLYVDRKFEKMVTDDSYPSGLNGIIAIGPGIHWFDNISVYQPLIVR